MMKRFIFLLAGLILNIVLSAHPWKPNHYVIIDTDGGIDDMKAISLFLASPDVRVLAITISPGALNTKLAYIKVKSLLNSCYHEGIPVGINTSSNFKAPDFNTAIDTKWGDETGIDIKTVPTSTQLINDIISNEKTKLSFVCLGSLSTVTLALKEIPPFEEQVKEIVWSSDGLTDNGGFNYNIDKESAVKTLKGNIPVRSVKGSGDETFYDDNLLKSFMQIPTIYAGILSSFFNSDLTLGHPFSFKAYDEMTVLYLHYPELFITLTTGINSESSPSDIKALRDKTNIILAGETVSKNQVIKEFPGDPSFFMDDIEPYVVDIIKKYGIDEWTSGVIANELHRHLGVFAIVGVKMGIRAREYFDTGVDEFKVSSFAGSTPPLSCMNDGIQVSTGATPGHGLLTVLNDLPALPSAEFTYLNRKIKLTLKADIAAKISSELKEINYIYGLDSNVYWELVRKNSIKYWLSLDRHDVFDIEELK